MSRHSLQLFIYSDEYKFRAFGSGQGFPRDQRARELDGVETPQGVRLSAAVLLNEIGGPDQDGRV